MISSLFKALVDKYLDKVVGKITETINGKDKEETLLYKEKLNTEFTPTLEWSNTELQGSIVSADVVSMDASIPLKSRPSMKRASGRIPKLGLKFPLKESVMSDINIMQAQGAPEKSIVAKLFDDVNRCIKGIEHRIEMMFLQGLSTGSILVEDSDTEGTGIRVNFGYLNENKFHALGAVWSTAATATPLTDINQLFDKAETDNASIAELWLSKQYLDYMRATKECKRLVAANDGYNIDDANLSTPTRKRMIEALEAEYECKVNVVNSKFAVEGHNGTISMVAPYNAPSVVAVPSNKVGTLFYGELAEVKNKVAGVNYTTADSFILVSKYAKTDPLQEYTAGQALAIPVINNVRHVYLLNANATS